MTSLEIARMVLTEIDEGRPDGERIVILARAVIALHAEVERFAVNWKLCESANDKLLADVEAIERNIVMDETTLVRLTPKEQP